MSPRVNQTSPSLAAAKFLLRHLGNMGDMLFIVPPVLAALKSEYPGCHITFVTSWGYKQSPPPFSVWPRLTWGKRNQDGHSLHLMLTNPHIDQLIHWHDRKTSLDATICYEDGRAFPTWSKHYYQIQKDSGHYTKTIELDFGLSVDDNPIEQAFRRAGVALNHSSAYRLYLSPADLAHAKEIRSNFPSPRIVLLESLASTTTRGWDPAKVKALMAAIKHRYHVNPIWFGASFKPYYHGRALSLRENIATLTYCDVGIGVLSGPLHFAAAVGLPTITLYCDHPVHRAAPAYFLNPAINRPALKHRTLLGPHQLPMRLLKGPSSSLSLTPRELARQNFEHWSNPGRQATKSCLAVITVDEVMTVLNDMLN